MLRFTYCSLSVLVCGLTHLAFAQTGAPITGSWNIGGPAADDRVQFAIQRNAGQGSHMSSSSPIALAELRGLTKAQVEAATALVRFILLRDAGTFQFEGYLAKGNGGGAFTFTQNPDFANEMRALGYSGLNDEKVFTMAVHDVSAQYVRDLNALGVRPESVDQLVTMRIHNVTADYIRQFKDLGYADLKADKLVTMRIHQVTPEFARELKGLGYSSVATEQMVTMRIHQVSPDFIKEVGTLGYAHPAIDQLLTMRIHQITPEFIRKAQAKMGSGVTIDQMVNLRIHGILD
jgi:hypothetical protein